MRDDGPAGVGRAFELLGTGVRRGGPGSGVGAGNTLEGVKEFPGAGTAPGGREAPGGSVIGAPQVPDGGIMGESPNASGAPENSPLPGSPDGGRVGPSQQPDPDEKGRSLMGAPMNGPVETVSAGTPAGPG